jgi:carboxymethylenebutenolidase
MMKKPIYLAIITCLIIVFTSGFNNLDLGFFKPSLDLNAEDKIFLSHEEDKPIPTPLVAQKPKNPVIRESVTYGQINDQDLVGYIAKPTNINKPLPALIVIHEWWGLNDNIKAMTDRLAGEGYLALAVDLYNGKVGENPETARTLVREAMANSKLLEENIKQAYNYLHKEEKAPKIASIGWCFGGSWSLKTALLFPEELDAAVIYYGGSLETDPNILQPLQMPILGIFGELDNNPPVAKVNQFKKALESLNKPVEIHIYKNADHAFANPSGTRYNAKAAEDAWQKTITFLNKNLPR